MSLGIERERLIGPYIVLVCLLAAVLLALVPRELDGDARWTTIFHAGVLGAMVAGARCFPINLSLKSKIFVDTSAVFAAVLLCPPLLAVAAVVAGVLVGEAVQGFDLQQLTFNVAETAVEVCAAVLVYHLLQPGGLGQDSTAAVDLVAAALTALTIYTLNLVLVDVIVSLSLGFGSIRWAMGRHSLDFPQQVAQYLMGFLIALTAYEHPLTLPLLAVPAAVVYLSLRDGHHLRTKAVETLESIADIVDMRDHYTFEHSTRVALLARDVAVEMGLSPDEISAIYLGGRVHDVGKIGIQSQVLQKEGPLTDEEWLEMKTHPQVGAELVSKFPDYVNAARLVVCHHERFDGGGYPRGLQRDEIPLGARIISVADTFDAMTSKRSYRDALAVSFTVNEIRRCSGSQFDPRCVEALLLVLEKRQLVPTQVGRELSLSPAVG